MPSKLEIARLEKLAGSPIPDDVLTGIESGKPEKLTTWMAENQILPTDKAWADFDLTIYPQRLREAMEIYKVRQDDLEALAELAGVPVTAIPKSILESLLNLGESQPYRDWLDSQGIRPTAEAWGAFLRGPASAGVKEPLVAYKTALDEAACAAQWRPWGQWSQCPATCGRAQRRRRRRQENPECEAEEEVLLCNLKFCPVGKGLESVHSHPCKSPWKHRHRP